MELLPAEPLPRGLSKQFTAQMQSNLVDIPFLVCILLQIY